MDYVPYAERKDFELASLIGETLTEVTGLEPGSEYVRLKTATSREIIMQHSSDCCETVSVEDITGDVADLIGSPLLVAEEATSGENPAGVVKEYQNSFTWTFYKFATIKGYVDVRWYGESNGYYSENVDVFEHMAGAQD